MYHTDKHVVKMIVEYAQILSTAHRVCDGSVRIERREKNGKTRRITRWDLPDSRNDILYLATHVQHPSMIWARWSKETYTYLLELFECLLQEYTHRYGKVHKSTQLLPTLKQPPTKLRYVGFREPFLAMPNQYVNADVVKAYRDYYISEKIATAKWTNRQRPAWTI
jgi:hypothetical protein